MEAENSYPAGLSVPSKSLKELINHYGGKPKVRFNKLDKKTLAKKGLML
ncbi:unnamed protein product, partial [marine sediment metagenome]